MILQLSEATLAQGATTLQQYFNVGAGLLGSLLGWLGEFILGRLEFAEQYPASALAGILVNAVAFWWLVRARAPAAFHRVVASQILR